MTISSVPSRSLRTRAIAIGTCGALALSLAGCGPQTGPNEVGGTLIGAVAGGAIGSMFGGGAGKAAAIVAGTMIGGYLGNTIGRNMDENARQQAYAAQMNAINAGQAQSWRAPSGAYGSVTPGPVYVDQSSQACRQYTHTIVVDGKRQTGTGTACRNPNGTWQIVS
jgi:surface antigen